MKCTNPRDVAFLFRQYARKLHAKAIPSDPSFVKLSIACGRVSPSSPLRLWFDARN